MVGVQPRYVRLSDRIVVDCDVFVLVQVGVWGQSIGNAGWHGACMGRDVGDFPGAFWSLVMNAAAITTKTITANINADMRTLEIVVPGFSAIVVAIDALTPSITTMATLHGLKQKIVDAAAIARNPDTGRSASVSDKYAAMEEVAARLISGEWNKIRGDGTTGAGGLLFRALCIAYGQKNPADIKTFLDGKTKAEQAALRKNPKIAAIIDTLREEDSGDVDTDEMLNELED